MNKEQIEEHNQELRKKFEEVAPGLFVVPHGYRRNKEDLMEAIKRRARWRKKCI